MSPHEHSEDAAAYALGALGETEAEAFRRHLDECVVCRDEVAAFREAVAALPGGEPQYCASKELRRRVIRSVRADARHRVAGPSVLRRGRRLVPRWRLNPAVALATAVVIGFATLAGVELATGPRSAAPRTIAASLGDAQLRVTGNHAELIVHHLPTLPAGKTYELWIERGQRAPHPTNTLFSVNDQGTANIGVPGTVSGDSSVLVTAEPAGGTQVPTTAPVVVARLG
jgi:anti-sigma-K factor RskA